MATRRSPRISAAASVNSPLLATKDVAASAAGVSPDCGAASGASSNKKKRGRPVGRVPKGNKKASWRSSRSKGPVDYSAKKAKQTHDGDVGMKRESDYTNEWDGSGGGSGGGGGVQKRRAHYARAR